MNAQTQAFLIPGAAGQLECALDLHSHALAPIADLPVLEVISAVHILSDLTLPLGTVAYDYLAK